MTTLVDELAQRARALSTQERALLAEQLLASLDAESELEAQTAWEQEIGRRVDEIRSGRAKLVPADEVFAETARIYE